jgi:hypothetical protein
VKKTRRRKMALRVVMMKATVRLAFKICRSRRKAVTWKQQWKTMRQEQGMMTVMMAAAI